MNKQLLAILVGVLCIVGATAQTEQEDQYTVDTAGRILDELLNDAVKNKEDLENQWAANKPLLEQNIQNLNDAHTRQKDQCDGLEKVLHNHERDLKQAQDFIEWINNKIKDNNDRLDTLLAARCQANQNYIEGLKNDKLALKLIAFLRFQISNKESFSLAQRKAMLAKIQSFLAIYKTGNYEALVQLEQSYINPEQYDIKVDQDVNSRSEEEIGIGHIDNDVQDLNLDGFESGQRKGWGTLQGELLQILDEFEAKINGKIARAQEDEIRAAQALAEFKIQIEQENERLRRDLAYQEQIAADLVITIAGDNKAHDECRAEEARILGQWNDAVTDLNNKQAEYDHRHANFEEEIETFEYVISLYKNIRSNTDDFKERVEDLEDTVVDNRDYNAREVPEIDFLNQ